MNQGELRSLDLALSFSRAKPEMSFHSQGIYIHVAGQNLPSLGTAVPTTSCNPLAVKGEALLFSVSTNCEPQKYCYSRAGL